MTGLILLQVAFPVGMALALVPAPVAGPREEATAPPETIGSPTMEVSGPSDPPSPDQASRTGDSSTSRAQLSIWTDTDWSDGNYNLSRNMELNLTPGEMTLASLIHDMVEVYSPTTQDGIPAMVNFEDNLVVSASSPGGSPQTTEIVSCDPQDLQCSRMAELEEDMVQTLVVSQDGDRVYIPGASPTNVSKQGSLYIHNGTTLTRKEVGDAQTDSDGVLSVAELNNKLYVSSTDDDDRAYVYRSVDDGDTWYKRQNLGNRPYRRYFNDMGVSGGTLFVQPDGYASEGATMYLFNGTAWKYEAMPGITDEYGAFEDTGDGIYFLDSGNLFRHGSKGWHQVDTPFSPTVLTTETYNSSSGNFSRAVPLVNGRTGHTSNLVDGSIITAGGFIGNAPLGTVELIDTTTGNLTTGTALFTPRAYHASVVLQDGTLFVTGGLEGLPPIGLVATASCEAYDASGDIWSIESSLSSPRLNHTATLLDDGKVLVAGGIDDTGTHLSSTEVYDPSSNSWSAGPTMASARANHAAVLLNDGTVLVAGGRDGSGALSSAEIYDPGAGSWSSLPAMPYGAYDLTATLMNDGDVLVVGGTDDGVAGKSESTVLDTSALTWGSTVAMSTARFQHSSILLSGGEVLVTGGVTSASYGATGPKAQLASGAETFSSGSWTSLPNSPSRERFAHTTVGEGDTLFIIGGGSAEDFAPAPFRAMTTTGPGGLIVATPAGSVHVMGPDGQWNSTAGDVTGGRGIREILVHHGRLHASVRDDSSVMVARAVLEGEMISRPYRFSGYSENATLEWDAIKPNGTNIRFQVRSARDLDGLTTSDFVGPDGTNSTYFTVPGTILDDIHLGHDHFQYKVDLVTTDSAVAPVIKEVRVRAQISPLTLQSITIVPEEATINADETLDFNATGVDQFDMTMNISPTWSTTGGLINPTTGLYTPREAGEWQVIARAMGREARANLTVEPGALHTIEVDPATWFGSTDEYQDFDAVGMDQWENEVILDPSWSVTGGGTIDGEGNFTATTPGEWKVIAEDRASGLSGNASIVVWAGSPADLSISPTNARLEAGEHVIFEAIVMDGDGNLLDPVVEWRTTGGGKINSLGNYTASTVGEWTVTANLSAYSLSASATVTVVPGPLEEIVVTPQEHTMTAGETLNLTATALDLMENEVSASISWGADGGGPISDGQYTPTVAGTWKIYANASGLSSSVTVEVRPASLALVEIIPDTVELEAGEGTRFTATAEDVYGNPITGISFTWGISDGLGQIDQDGGFRAGEKSMEGQVTATATYGDSTETGVATVMVKGEKDDTVEEPEPMYYFILEVVILVGLVAVGALVANELSNLTKKEPEMKKSSKKKGQGKGTGATSSGEGDRSGGGGEGSAEQTGNGDRT